MSLQGWPEQPAAVAGSWVPSSSDRNSPCPGHRPRGCDWAVRAQLTRPGVKAVVPVGCLADEHLPGCLVSN